MITITKNNFNQEIEQSDKPIIIDVFATWCGPCLHMAPIFEEVAHEFQDTYKFAKLNVDEARELAIAYGVTSVPTFVFIKENKVKGKEVGYMSKEELVQKIKEFLG